MVSVATDGHREPDLAIIREAQGGSIDAQNRLVLKHRGFVAMMTLRVLMWFRRGDELEQFVGVGTEAFIGCIYSFREDGGAKLISYSARPIKWRVGQELRSDGVIRLPMNPRPEDAPMRRKARRIVPLDPELDRVDVAEPVGQVEFAELRRALEHLGQRERFVLDRRMSGWTLREIGEELGWSRERVRQIEVDAIAQCRIWMGVPPPQRRAPATVTS